MIIALALKYHRALIGVGLIALALIGWRIWLWQHDKAVIDAHEDIISAQVTAQSIEAAERAAEATSDTKGKIDASNEQARRDAAVSDDPLRAGFDSLRSGSRPTGKAAH